MKRFVGASAWLLGACVVNGQPYGGGASTTPPPGPPPSSSGAQRPPTGYESAGVYEPDGSVRGDVRYYTEPPYSNAPVDPWAAVAGDQPLRWSADAARNWKATSTDAACTARIDHCLVRETWFFVSPADIEAQVRRPLAQVSAAVGVFGPDGPARPWNAQSRVQGQDLIAYRTVPATKANLIVGELVIGLPRDRGIPRSGISALETGWVYGTLESVDYDLGVYQIKGYRDTLALEGARVPVLQYREGGRVEIVGNRRREQLAVRASDVFMPPP